MVIGPSMIGPFEPTNSVCPSGAARATYCPASVPAAARPVLDHDRLAERVAEPGLQRARADVDIAAGRIGHDEDDRPGGERLRAGGRRQCREQERAHDPTPPRRVSRTAASRRARTIQRMAEMTGSPWPAVIACEVEEGACALLLLKGERWCDSC